MNIWADMHIHSCLSPCGDDSMTPNNIVNMAYIKGLNMIAVCDHNCAANLPAIIKAAQPLGICVVPAIEVETCEEVHILAYFKSLSDALSFSDIIYSYLPDIPNNPKFFGEQIIMDENDEEIGKIKKLLIQPLELDLTKTVSLIRANGGAAVPAHIDKDAHGIINVLGFIDPHLEFSAVEISKHGMAEKFSQFDPRLKTTFSSDAHQLEDISERIFSMELKDCTAEAFIKYIENK